MAWRTNFIYIHEYDPYVTITTYLHISAWHKYSNTYLLYMY